MRKLKLFKSLLVVAMLLVGGVSSVWGAGYTRTLENTLAVNGYKAKAFYDFQNNSPAVLPTSGDLRYRAYENGGYWGLHNHGSGDRSASVTIPVASTDILIIQNYTNYTSTINCGSVNTTLTASTGYQVFDISTTADNITFSVPRYGGIVAAFVMEKDNSVKTGNYTINYKSGGTTVKTVSGTDVAVGTQIPVLSSFTEGGKKYITNGGQASSLTIAEGENNLDIAVTEPTKYTCAVNAKAGDVLLATEEEDVYDGENVTVYYQMAYAKDGKWYFIDKNGSAPGYGVAFNGVTSNQVENKTTYSLNENVVYFGEAENMTLSGSFAADGNYLNWRSNGGAKRLSVGAYVYSNVIAPGVYDVTLWARNNRSAGDGTETLPIFLRDEDGNLTDLGVSFPGWARGGYEAAKTATITIPDDGKNYSVVINNNTGYTSNLEMDYLYLTKKETVSVSISDAGWATLYTPCAVNFSGVTGLTAYTATCSGNTVTLNEVTTVPANTGVVLKGAAGNYGIPVIASSSTGKGNLEGSATAATAWNGVDGKDLYVLVINSENKAQFTKATSGSIPAGKAYLPIATGTLARTLSVEFDGDATGINNATAEMKAEDAIFNLAGQRVAQPANGLYIVNGKKVIVK